MELRHYLRVLLRRWPVIAVTVVVALAVALAVSTPATTVWAARSTIVVGPRQYTFGNSATSNLPTPEQAVGIQYLMQTYADLVPSRTVAEAAVAATKVPRTPAQVAAETTAAPVASTQLLTVTVTDPDPRVATALSAATADAFVARVGALPGPGGTVQGAADAGGSSATASGTGGSGAVPAISMAVFAPATGAAPVTSGGRGRSLAVAGLFGLLVAVALVVLAEYLDGTVRDPDRVERRLGLPVLGVIPTVAPGGRSTAAPSAARFSGDLASGDPAAGDPSASEPAVSAPERR